MKRTFYVFEWYGVFTGSYSDDEGTAIGVKLMISKDKKATLFIDGSQMATYTVSEYSSTGLVLYSEAADSTYNVKYNETKNAYTFKDGDYMEKSALLSFVSYASNPLENKTFVGTCGDDETHKFVFKENFKVDYIVEGSISVLDMDLDISDYPTSITLTSENLTTYIEEGSVKITFTSADSFKVNMHEGCGSVIYKAQ